jgi:hypothetical protein
MELAFLGAAGFERRLLALLTSAFALGGTSNTGYLSTSSHKDLSYIFNNFHNALNDKRVPNHEHPPTANFNFDVRLWSVWSGT